MQNIIYVFIFISCTILVYFILFLIGTHISITYKNNKKNRIKNQIQKAIENKDVKFFDSRSSKDILVIDAISEEFENISNDNRKVLVDLLNESNYKEYIKKIIKLNKVNDDTVFYIKFAGDLKIKSLSGKLISLMKKYQNDIDLQYYCLDALSKFGDKTFFLKALNLGYTIKLTSRALQEIFSDYTGDYEELFTELLDSTDSYVVRIVILMIGDLKIENLIPDLVKYIYSDDMDIAISAIKVLARMKYKRAYKDIVKMKDSYDWQVRSVVLKYAGKLDLDSSIDILLNGLKDKEWWVQFNAAKALAKSKNRDEILKKVKSLNDKYVLSIFNYAVKDYKLNGGE